MKPIALLQNVNFARYLNILITKQSTSKIFLRKRLRCFDDFIIARIFNL